MELSPRIHRNPTAVLSLKALPATVLELMAATGMSRNSVRNAVKTLKEEKVIHISAYRLNVGCHAAVYKLGNLPDIAKASKKTMAKARHRRHYLKKKVEQTGVALTQWRTAPPWAVVQ